ncbi:hypothetical protein KCP78_23450 [Salmonella enterica subsp. enterica]|nr:hypothetical protein KCP78_23450 [Salmonella enterica subsp. enterica]
MRWTALMMVPLDHGPASSRHYWLIGWREKCRTVWIFVALLPSDSIINRKGVLLYPVPDNFVSGLCASFIDKDDVSRKAG